MTLRTLVLAALLAGCAAPAAETALPAAAPPAPFEAEGSWWVEPPQGQEPTRHEVALELGAGLARLHVDVALRSTYVVDLPASMADVRVALLDPAGAAVHEARLGAGAPEGSLLAEQPAAGSWTLLVEAYGGSGGGMGDSISWRAVGSA